MSDESKATISNSRGTIKSFVEPQVAETVAPTPTEPIITPALAEAAVNEQGVLHVPEPPAPVIEPAPISEPTAPEEANEMSFSMGFEDDAPAPAIAAPQGAQPTPQDWKQILKTLDKKEVAKELGINDFALEINEHISRGGSAIDYLNARAVDYTKFSHSDLVMDDLQSKYPKLAKEKIQKLFDAKYKQSEFATEDEKEIGAIELEGDAEVIRQKKMQEQAQYKIPEAKNAQEANVEYEQLKAEIASKQKETENAKNFVINHPSVKSLVESKRVTIDLGEGVKPFNYTIDKPELFVKALLDANFYQKIMSNEKGELDLGRIIRMIKYGINPDKHDRDIYNYGTSKGVDKLVHENQNAKLPDGRPIAPQVQDEKELWKKPVNGKIGNHFKPR